MKLYESPTDYKVSTKNRLGRLINNLSEEWVQWRELLIGYDHYLETNMPQSARPRRRKAVADYFQYYLPYAAPYTSEGPIALFKGTAQHKVSSDEFKRVQKELTNNTDHDRAVSGGHVNEFLEFVLEKTGLPFSSPHADKIYYTKDISNIVLERTGLEDWAEWSLKFRREMEASQVDRKKITNTESGIIAFIEFVKDSDLFEDKTIESVFKFPAEFLRDKFESNTVKKLGNRDTASEYAIRAARLLDFLATKHPSLTREIDGNQVRIFGNPLSKRPSDLIKYCQERWPLWWPLISLICPEDEGRTHVKKGRYQQRRKTGMFLTWDFLETQPPEFSNPLEFFKKDGLKALENAFREGVNNGSLIPTYAKSHLEDVAVLFSEETIKKVFKIDSRGFDVSSLYTELFTTDTKRPAVQSRKGIFYVKNLHDDLKAWEPYVVEYIASKVSALDNHISGINHFLAFLTKEQIWAVSPEVYLSKPAKEMQHFIAFKDYLTDSDRSHVYVDRIINKVHQFFDYIIDQNFIDISENGARVKRYHNPFLSVKAGSVYTQESVKSALPYRYILKLRELLISYRSNDIEKPWRGHHFKDWTWAIDNLGSSSWASVSADLIDTSDPDCVFRPHPRDVSKVLLFTPTIAVLFFLRLHLPLRSFQARFLDSGESDTYKFENFSWVLNTSKLAKGTENKPYSRGVFRRRYDSDTMEYDTSIFISTNKTADRDKDDYQRGYEIPWRNEEVLYWLEKLRDFQSKYNPIERPTHGTELESKHFGGTRSTAQKEQIGEFCFLFRGHNGAPHQFSYAPIAQGTLNEAWRTMCYELQEMINSDREEAGSLPIEIVSETSTKLMFSPHSLRVSLVTAYIDSNLPLPIVSKLLVGHSSILMSIYYNKLSPSKIASKLREAEGLMRDSENEIQDFIETVSSKNEKLIPIFNNLESANSVMKSGNAYGEKRALGLCLVGADPSPSEIKTNTTAGCHNGGPLALERKEVSARVYEPVRGGAGNCVRCRWFATDASFLPQLVSHANYNSYLANRSAKQASRIEAELDALRKEQYQIRKEGGIFTKSDMLTEFERRYEKAMLEANEFVENFVATFRAINRIMLAETSRDSSSTKLIAMGTQDDISDAIKLIETNSELLHISTICEDAEIFPELADSLLQTDIVEKRTRKFTRMMCRGGYEPLLLDMDPDMQLKAGNALMRKMAEMSGRVDKIEGFAVASNYIEQEKWLEDSGLLELTMNGIDFDHAGFLKSDSENVMRISYEQ